MKAIFKIIIWFHTLLFLGLFFISDQDSSASVNIHDTYYVMGKQVVYFTLFMLFLITGLFDLIMIKSNNLFSIIHLFISIIVIWGFLFIDYLYQKSLSDNNLESLINHPNYNFYLIMLIFILLVIQVLFFINIFAVIITKMRRQSASK